VYFIIRNKNDHLPSDPRLRKIATDAWDKAQSLPLKDAAKERRKLLREKRFTDIAQRPDLTEEKIVAMKAIRKNMEHRIND